MSRTSSVIAIANTPSLKASVRPVSHRLPTRASSTLDRRVLSRRWNRRLRAAPYLPVTWFVESRRRDALSLVQVRRSDLLRDAARQGEDDAHRLVSEVGGRVEHARAAAVDHRDAVLAAEVGRLS